MLVQIVKHTPVWVFVLFFVLVVYGYWQTRDKSILPYRVAILPAIMILLSFYGVLSAFGLSRLVLLFWVAGVGIAVWVGMLIGAPRGVHYSSTTRLYSVPGSWLPLGLMMVIFFTKYTVGVLTARHIAIVKTEDFAILVGCTYGFLSGLFLSRAFVIWRVRPRQPGS